VSILKLELILANLWDAGKALEQARNQRLYWWQRKAIAWTSPFPVGHGDINTLAQDEMLLMPCPYKRPDLFLDASLVSGQFIGISQPISLFG
jgi:hypothetical protein